MKNKFAISNDWHLATKTESQIIQSTKHIISEMVRLELNEMVIAGDVFDSRSMQRQSTLLTLDKVFDMFHKAGITIHLFPGNHDKSVYESKDSFLRVYKHHPAVTYYENPTLINIAGISIFIVPFFVEETLVKILKEGQRADLLISHFDLNGSSHLGRVKSGSKISASMLKKWKKTYLGHYHNRHEVTENVIHLQSLFQRDFGETSDKGFTVIKEDLSYEVIRGHFKEFNKIVVDLDKTTTNELKTLIKLHQNSQDVVRFELIGTDEKLKAINKKQFSDVGIDCKVKYKEVYDIENVELPKLPEKYSVDNIEEDFEVFCEEKELDVKKGKKHLNKFLKRKESNE